MRRKRVFSILCFAVMLVTLSACQADSGPDPATGEPPATPVSGEPDGGPSDVPAGGDSIDWIVPSNDIDMDGFHLFWRCDNVQLADDKSAALSIYVKAEVSDSGEFLFDDGQDWLVLMETSSGDYPLFPRQYVQLGGVSCAVFNDYAGDETVSHVVVTVRQTAGYQIYDCVFDSEKAAFAAVPVYDAQAVNFIAASP